VKVNPKEELIKIVGAEYFSDDPEILKQYSKDYSLVPPRMPTYVVKPKNAEEIQKIVKLANELKMPIIPCSSGVHFYGATIPSQGGIVIDLERMNRILEIDERNRKVRIEPRVTWGQLQAELKKHDLMALNPLLPHASKSALTSHLEREPMLIPKFEYSEPTLTMEVVLPTGEIFRTGSASAPNALSPKANTDLCNPQGPGTNFFQLFHGAQGTLGIVTWINVKVEYLPKVQKIFFIPFKKIEDAIEPLYRIQRLMIGNECLLLNNFNLANILTEKWPGDFEALREALPPFTIILVLAGGRRLPEEKIEYEEEALMRVGSELLIEILPRLPGAPRRAERLILERLRSPWPEEETYWKFRYKGSCQDVFFHTTLNKVPELTELIHQLAARHEYPGRDIGFYLQPLERSRVAHCEYSFYYNPEDSREVENMRSLYVEAVESLVNMGAFFTRPYGQAADIIYNKSAAYTMALKKVKNIFDPNNILNPGKLCF
jgi:hypothetical protein